MSLPASSRLVTARAMTAVLFSLLFLVASVPAVAQDERAVVEVAAPRVGDKAVYVLTVVREGSAGVEAVKPPRNVSTFEWIEPVEERNARGDLRRVNRLVETRSFTNQDPVVSLRTFDASTGAPITRTDISEGGSGGDSLFRTRFMTTPERARSIASDSAFCGASTDAFTGRTLTPGDSGPLFADACWLADNVMMPMLGGVNFTFARRIETGGETVHSFDSVPHRETNVWFAPGIPYPVRIAFPYSGEPGETSGEIPDMWVVVRLSEFRAGTAPLATRGDVEGAAALGPPTFTARRAWGPDDSASQLAFPLSRAFQLARDHENGTLLRTFLRDHPSAYTAAARHDFVDGDQPENVWRFTVTDGLEAVVVSVSQMTVTVESQPEGPVPGVGIPGGEPTRKKEVRHIVEATSAGPGDAPLPEVVPDEYPTVGTLARMWGGHKRIEQSEVAVNDWGFHISKGHCPFESGPCPASAVFSVGHVGSDADGTPRESTLTVNAAGVPLSLDERLTITLAEGETIPMLWDASIDARPTSLLVTSHAFLPRPVQWTLGAMLLAVALYIGRAPLVVLFSRMGRATIAKHPARARMLGVLAEQPDLTGADIARAIDLPERTARYHLGRLVKAGLVVAHRADHVVLHRLASTGMPEGAAALSAERLRVLRSLHEAPSGSARELAGRLELDPTTVHHHLKRLERAGYVATIREGRYRRATLTDKGLQLTQNQEVNA